MLACMRDYSYLQRKVATKLQGLSGCVESTDGIAWHTRSKSVVSKETTVPVQENLEACWEDLPLLSLLPYEKNAPYNLLCT